MTGYLITPETEKTTRGANRFYSCLAAMCEAISAFQQAGGSPALRPQRFLGGAHLMRTLQQNLAEVG
jgi:hypothetical protein